MNLCVHCAKRARWFVFSAFACFFRLSFPSGLDSGRRGLLMRHRHACATPTSVQRVLFSHGAEKTRFSRFAQKNALCVRVPLRLGYVYIRARRMRGWKKMPVWGKKSKRVETTTSGQQKSNQSVLLICTSTIGK